MNPLHIALEPLGWSPAFAEQIPTDYAGPVARVAAVDREQWLLVDASGFFRAKVAGRFLHRAPELDDFPCVGDWVLLDKADDGDLGVIHSVVPRRTALRRKAAGSSGAVQMIAANIDQVVIVQSCHFDFNVNRLERYLVMVSDSGAQASVLLTKSDLVPPATLAEQQAQIRAAGIEVPLLTLSNVTQDGVDAFEKSLAPGHTYCFVGSSGVGKSTLINHLVGRDVLDTNSVSGTGEGRHTTVRRELIRLSGGALVIDNPGMREFGILAAEVSGGFQDVDSFAQQCRYRDCTHVSEPGCAVLAALEAGDLDQDHYDNFLKLRNEAEFHKMTKLERRQKDRAFGRFVKSVKKRVQD